MIIIILLPQIRHSMCENNNIMSKTVQYINKTIVQGFSEHANLLGSRFLGRGFRGAGRSRYRLLRFSFRRCSRFRLASTFAHQLCAIAALFDLGKNQTFHRYISSHVQDGCYSILTLVSLRGSTSARNGCRCFSLTTFMAVPSA